MTAPAVTVEESDTLSGAARITATKPQPWPRAGMHAAPHRRRLVGDGPTTGSGKFS